MHVRPASEGSVLANRYGLQIRAAAGADALGLGELLAAAGQPVPVGVLAERLEALNHAGSVVLIAVEWGPPTGLVVVTWARTLTEDAPVAQISLLLVAPDERRRGVGRLLLKAASQAARNAGCGTMLLTASSAHDASLSAFCAATGFEIQGAVYARPLRKKLS